ncbi:MAG: phosphotransferase [Roseovarius sp.]
MTDLIDALRAGSALIGDAAKIARLPGDAEKGAGKAADATAKYTVQLASGERTFLIVSSAGNPDLAARAARNIAAIRARLSPATAAPVAEPLETGTAQGLSYTLWPMLTPWPEGRLTRFIAKRRTEPQVLAWLLALMRETKAPMTEASKARALHYLARVEGDTAHSDAARRCAGEAAGRIAQGHWAPVTCVQHSDLWLGNVMLAPEGARGGFRVIDWAGARLEGYPFFDLGRFAISCGTSGARLRRAIMEGLRACDSACPGITPYVLCALGQIGDDLEHFPEAMFRAMLRDTVAFSLRVDEGLA